MARRVSRETFVQTRTPLEYVLEGNYIYIDSVPYAARVPVFQ